MNIHGFPRFINHSTNKQAIKKYSGWTMMLAVELDKYFTAHNSVAEKVQDPSVTNYKEFNN